MASRRRSAVPSSFLNASSDPKGSKSVGNGKETVQSSRNVVKSRYQQSAEKTSLSKSNSLADSFAVPQRPSSPKPPLIKPKFGTSPRRSLASQALAESKLHKTNPSLLGKSMLQSTFSDDHCFRPDFDISVIKDKTVIENAAEPDKNPENEKDVERQTLLLAYLTAKMESNITKYKAEAEEKILRETEEEAILHKEVNKKKRKYLLAEKKRLLNELLDLQIEMLTPVTQEAKQFSKNYQGFAAAVDVTRHQLPVKNFCMTGEGREFLDKAEACLKETEKLLLEYTQGDHVENSTSLDCLRDIKITSKEISQDLVGTFSELRELSALICRHSVMSQVAIEEEQLGSSRLHELYGLKK